MYLAWPVGLVLSLAAATAPIAEGELFLVISFSGLIFVLFVYDGKATQHTLQASTMRVKEKMDLITCACILIFWRSFIFNSIRPHILQMLNLLQIAKFRRIDSTNLCNVR